MPQKYCRADQGVTDKAIGRAIFFNTVKVESAVKATGVLDVPSGSVVWSEIDMVSNLLTETFLCTIENDFLKG